MALSEANPTVVTTTKVAYEQSHAEAVMEQLIPDPLDRAALGNLFHYCQFLLDDEEMMTKGGNLDSEARELLHQRMAEVFGYVREEAPSESELDLDDFESETDA